MAVANRTHRIAIGGDWTLEDLYEFPHVYSQVYTFLYSFREGFQDQRHEDLESAYLSYPWRGGYSAVNFYGRVEALVPSKDRPRLLSMRYGSPGWMDLGLVVAVATSIGILVNRFVKAIDQVNTLYTSIHKGLHERKLMKIDAKTKDLAFRRDELRFIQESTDSMSRLLGFRNAKSIDRLTGNPLATLKILLSLYRRVRTLAAYQDDGKVKF